MKSFTIMITVTAIGLLFIGMHSVPAPADSSLRETAGEDALPVPQSIDQPPPVSDRGEVPCEGTRFVFETPNFYSVTGGEGEGRAIGFYVEETTWITSFGILADMTTSEYHEVVLYSSPDGHSAGSVLQVQTEWVTDEGWGWYDIPIRAALEGGSYYVLNWRPADHGDNDWADSLSFYNDSGLPYTVGPFELLEGIEGYDAENAGNFLHALHRVCEGSPWTLCFYDENYFVTDLYVRLDGTVLQGQAILDGQPFGAITGTISSGRAYFSIDYLDDLGMRFYDVDISTRSGTTWGVETQTGEYYDWPHSAQLNPCGTFMGAGTMETGALEK